MSFKESVTINDAIQLLNELLLVDREAVQELINVRVSVNAEFAKHPTVMVLRVGDQEKVGVLGILNGLFGNENGSGPIMAILQDGEIVAFTHTARELYADAGNSRTPSSNG